MAAGHHRRAPHDEVVQLVVPSAAPRGIEPVEPTGGIREEQLGRLQRARSPGEEREREVRPAHAAVLGEKLRWRSTVPTRRRRPPWPAPSPPPRRLRGEPNLVARLAEREDLPSGRRHRARPHTWPSPAATGPIRPIESAVSRSPPTRIHRVDLAAPIADEGPVAIDRDAAALLTLRATRHVSERRRDPPRPARDRILRRGRGTRGRGEASASRRPFGGDTGPSQYTSTCRFPAVPTAGIEPSPSRATCQATCPVDEIQRVDGVVADRDGRPADDDAPDSEPEGGRKRHALGRAAPDHPRGPDAPHHP
jgi:hypothetical protein